MRYTTRSSLPGACIDASLRALEHRSWNFESPLVSHRRGSKWTEHTHPNTPSLLLQKRCLLLQFRARGTRAGVQYTTKKHSGAGWNSWRAQTSTTNASPTRSENMSGACLYGANDERTPKARRAHCERISPDSVDREGRRPAPARARPAVCDDASCVGYPCHRNAVPNGGMQTRTVRQPMSAPLPFRDGCADSFVHGDPGRRPRVWASAGSAARGVLAWG